MTATVTITRHLDGKSTITLVRGKKYTEDEIAQMPTWYREYLTVN